MIGNEMEEYADEEQDDLLGNYAEPEHANNHDLFSDDEQGDHSEAEEVPVGEEENGESGAPKKSKPVKPKKEVKNPQPKLNFETLKGKKGLIALNDLFKDFTFRGSGHERQDLAAVMSVLEQWAHRLYPKFHFEDTLLRLESLGKKKYVQNYLTKIRIGLVDNDEVINQFDDNEDEDDTNTSVPTIPHVYDEFDELLAQQIEATQSRETATLSAEQLERIERNKRNAISRRAAMSAHTVGVTEETSESAEESTTTPHEESAAVEDATEEEPASENDAMVIDEEAELCVP